MLACLLAGRYAAYWLCYEDTDTSCRVVDCLTVLHVNVSVNPFFNGKELHTRSYNRHVQSVNMSILMGNKCLCESHIFPMNCNAELCVLHILIWLIPCFGFSFCRMVGLVWDTAVCLSKTCSWSQLQMILPKLLYKVFGIKMFLRDSSLMTFLLIHVCHPQCIRFYFCCSVTSQGTVPRSGFVGWPIVVCPYRDTKPGQPLSICRESLMGWLVSRLDCSTHTTVC